MLIVAPSIYHLGGVAYLSKFPNGRRPELFPWGGFRPSLIVDLAPDDALALAKTREGQIVEVDTRSKRIWMDIPWLQGKEEDPLAPVNGAVTDGEDLAIPANQFVSLGWGCITHAGTPVESRQHSGVAA